MPVACRLAAVRMSPSGSGSAQIVNTSSPTKLRTSSGIGLPLYGWPWRIDFSRADAALIASSGSSETSTSQ